MKYLSVHVDRLQKSLPTPVDKLGMISQKCDDRLERIASLALKRVGKESERVSVLKEKILRFDPKTKIAFQEEKIEGYRYRLQGLVHRIRESRERLESRVKLLESSSYKKRQEQGWIFVTDTDKGKPIKTGRHLKDGKYVILNFQDEKVGAVVERKGPRLPGI